MWILYHASIYLMVLAIRISSLWNPKSFQWISGRHRWREDINKHRNKKGSRIWIHAASLGEFEQVKPVIEKIKNSQPEVEIILSFFSPSGFLQKRDYKLATVLYLPADISENAKYWVNALQPDIALFVKYDLWPGYLKALTQNKIPTILISAFWKPGSIFQSWALPPTKNLLKKFNRIFFQRSEYLQYFKEEGFNNIEVAGDTRIDRSLELPVEISQRLPIVLQGASFDLVAGSTWPEDEKLLIHSIEEFEWSWIIAPHDVSRRNVERLQKKLGSQCVALSNLKPGMPQPKILLIDSVGMLSVLYSIGKIAYVGGGFGKGIHNILEPMAHGKPVIFGPRYRKFPEAIDMVAAGSAFSVSDERKCIEIMQALSHPGLAEAKGRMAFQYLADHSGATDKVTNYILESIPSRIQG